MLDQATFKRCETKEGSLNFARVLVDANASNGLPEKVKINLPTCEGIPVKSYFLDLSYKWKPPCCSSCEVFGHSDGKCGLKLDKVQKGYDKNWENVVVSYMGKAQNDEFVEVVRKSKAQNKGKKPMWQPKNSVNQAGPSGLKTVAGQEKPSDKAVGLRDSSDSDPVAIPLKAVSLMCTGPIQEAVAVRAGFGDYGPIAGQLSKDQLMGSAKGSCPSTIIYSPVLEPVLEADRNATGMAQKRYGSSYFDVSKNSFGSQSGPTCKSTNSFDMLRDEVDYFDTDLGLWEHEVEVVKKFVESNTRPKIEVYDALSVSMKKYYDGLTKMNEDDEVASETDETARFMKSGVKS